MIIVANMSMVPLASVGVDDRLGLDPVHQKNCLGAAERLSVVFSRLPVDPDADSLTLVLSKLSSLRTPAAVRRAEGAGGRSRLAMVQPQECTGRQGDWGRPSGRSFGVLRRHCSGPTGAGRGQRSICRPSSYGVRRRGSSRTTPLQEDGSPSSHSGRRRGVDLRRTRSIQALHRVTTMECRRGPQELEPGTGADGSAITTRNQPSTVLAG
jgi:hypothetical protein